MPKNAQAPAQLLSFHMLALLCSKSFKLGFSSTWTENLKIYKLDLEKVEEPEIKLSTFVGSWRKQGSSRETSTSVSLTMLKPLTYVWIITNCGKFLKRQEYQTSWPASWEICMWVKKQQNQTWDKWLVPNRERSISPCLINFYVEYIMWNARQITSWNQDCQGAILTTSDMQMISL